ncbi:hypothetical protein JN535_11400 [Cellulosimicrobium cellulans]|uniref:hypothetical protein n=1 Tax=Cellulosimicrobium cellulans TaxID=1710 RepID=UPI00196561E6|nr:hypothetical protein [Cellulosimicrobium cellulans]MBN0040769.1 hypothetical protein [Cellulosimicrobium cellulans]
MIELAMGDAAKRQVLRSNMTMISIFAPLVGLAQLPAAIASGNPALALGFLAFALSMIPLTYATARRMVDRTRIVLGDGTYTVHGWGRTKRFTVADVDRVVTVDRMAFGPAKATHHLIVVGPTTRLLLLVGQMWDREQLSTVALDLARRGVPLTPWHRPVTPAQLRAFDRRLVPWRQAHPVALGLLVGLGTLLVLVVLLVVVVALVV